MTNRNIQKALLSILPFIFILLLYFLFSDWLNRLDLAITELVFKQRSPIGDAYFLSMTHLGDKEFVTMFTVGAVLLIALALRKWKTALLYGITIAIGNLWLNPALKDLFQRVRPDETIWMVVEESFSFPSGHSFVAGTVYPLLVDVLLRNTKLSRYSAIVYAILALLVFSIAFSRIYLGVHFLTDVLGGLSLGFSFQYLTRFVLEKVDE